MRFGSFLRAIIRHSAMPVSDEKDISRPLAAMLNTDISEYPVGSIWRKLARTIRRR